MKIVTFGPTRMEMTNWLAPKIGTVKYTLKNYKDDKLVSESEGVLKSLE